MDRFLFVGLTLLLTILLTGTSLDRQPGFRVLVLAENSGHHIRYTGAATTWLNTLAAEHNFSVDYIDNTEGITENVLSQYQLLIQLDYPPYGWKPEAAKAFVNYMQSGNGGWIGFHHATLLGEFDGHPMWNWFSQFMGGIRIKNYIASFVTATVKVEDRRHPVMLGVPETFVVYDEEWYTYDKSPRGNVHVIASVDESSYQPETDIKMGDHPVVWSNPDISSRNIYIFMGHRPEHFDNTAYVRLFSNAIFWAAGVSKR
jgi:type 1 glutamine amidotransferase